MMKRAGVLLGLVLGAVIGSARTGQAQPATIVLSVDSLTTQSEIDLSVVPWRYRMGDDPAWARPNHPDSTWQLQRPDFTLDSLAALSWRGIGWFRLTLIPDSSLHNTTLTLSLFHLGASEVYLNGVFVDRFGQVSAAAEEQEKFAPLGVPLELYLDSRPEHLLAIRYSFAEARRTLSRYGHWQFNDLVGFQATLGVLSPGVGAVVKRGFGIDYFSILAVVGFLHLMLFMFDRRAYTNLYLGLLSAALALHIQVFYFGGLTLPDVDVLLYLGGPLGLGLALMMLPVAVHALFYARVRRWLWVVLAVFVAIIGVGFFVALPPVTLILFMVFFGLEALRVVGMAMLNKKEGAWIVGIGTVLFAVGATMLAGQVFFGMLFEFSAIAVPFAFLGLPLSMSILLARRFTLTNRRLEEQLAKVQELSAKSLDQEREKQRLITAQNEQLEAEVAARTAELSESLDELKATQQQLVQQEKIASLGQLTAGIAHEIKNPLNFVNNFAALSIELIDEMAEEREAEPDKPISAFAQDLDDLRLNAEKIEEHGRRADGIVRAMMQHARGGEGTRAPTDLNELLEEYVMLAYHGMRASTPDFNVTIERDYDEAVGAVKVVPQEIGRVFINLLNNAFYAVHEQQEDAEADYAPTVSIATRRADDRVVIEVKDNGPGMTEAVRDKVFEPFYTTKPSGQGTGLGLSLSHDIVVQGHGGTMAVESTEGEGTTFIITLPDA